MKPRRRPTQSVILVGAGHVHMALLAQSERLRAAGVRLTLVDPGSFWSGLRPGAVAAGVLDVACLRRPLARFCREIGVTHYSDRAIGLDTRHRRLWLAGGERLNYQRVSLNVGLDVDSACESARFDARAGGVQVWRAAAMRQLVQMHDAIRIDADGGRPPRVAVAGGSRRGAEIVAGLSQAPFAGKCRLAWYLPTARPVAGMPRGAVRRLLRLLGRRGVDVLAETAVTGVGDGCVRSRDGRRFMADHLVLTDTGTAARFVHAGRLPADAGGLRVTARLHSPVDTRIFAVGGCARMKDDRALAVEDIERQARVLAHNLVAGSSSQPLRSYRAGEPVWRSVDLADGSALAWRGRFWCQRRCAARVRERRVRRLEKRLMSRG